MKATKHSDGPGKRNARAAAGVSKSKAPKQEPLTVGRMLRNVKAKLAGLRTGKAETPNAAVASVVDLAKKREAAKAARANVKTKAPTLKQALKSSGGEPGFTERAENANVRSITKQSGKKGVNAHPALGNVGARHH